MPSRQLLTPPPLPVEQLQQHNHRGHPHFLLPILFSALILFLVSLLLFLFFSSLLRKKLSFKRTAPSPSSLSPPPPPHKFSYTLLKHATSSFSPSNKLGQGGFGSVFKGTLPTGQNVAVKVMDSGTLQGEREFNNELSLASKINSSSHVLSILGFASDSRRHRLVLVYELMSNGSLQDAILFRKPLELMQWSVRFNIACDVANGIYFLHNSCDPPVIHGDIKPSNVLLDCVFRAKVADFGLARVKCEEDHVVEEDEGESKLVEDKSREGGIEVGEDNASILEETESVATGFEDGGNRCGVDRSPESCFRGLGSEASPSELLEKSSVSEGYFDKFSVDSGKDVASRKVARKKSGSARDWWWKQDNVGGSESGRIKDYVMEWIGNEIKKERPKTEWIASCSTVESCVLGGKTEQKKNKKRLEWWASYDEERIKRKEKNRKPREWWKEEFCEELAKKSKKKRRIKSGSGGNGGESRWQRDEELGADRKKRKSKGSIDWWLDGLSGELRNGWRNSQDWASTDIPKSGGVSSTPSMRGTVCYIAPEYGGGGQLSEKCDVYSFGVLILVLISGRRPLQVTASPISEFERANLVSWARQLAHSGKLLDLVDPDIQSLDRDQALLCITIALLCLQRSPSKRPTMKEIVGMLSGETEPPNLPFEFSPSPPSNFPFKTRRKHR